MAFRPAFGGVRFGIDEDVAVIERGDELERLRQQHAIAEHITGQVAAARDANWIGLDIHPRLEEVALDRDPCALRGDAHRLVVVAVAPARGERVTEPEAVFKRNGVGDVRKSGRSLVGGNNEIGVVAVEDRDPIGVDDLFIDDVVGHRQQRPNENAIGFGTLGKPGIALGRRAGQVLGVKAALGAGWHDDRVLDQLGLHETEDFGAEIVAAIGPAQASTRNRAAAQMDALDAR